MLLKIILGSTFAFLRSSGPRILRWCLVWFASLVAESLRVFLSLILGFIAAAYMILSSFDAWFPVLIGILKFLAKILSHFVRFLLWG